MSDGTTTSTNTQACPECGSEDNWGGTSWCPSCGYYPAMNYRQPAAEIPPEEPVYEHWWEVVPGWSLTLVVGVSAIVAVSFAVRWMFPDGPVRTWWTVGQMVCGLVSVCTIHLMAYLYSASRTDSLGPLDMLVSPLATWQPVFRNLPQSSNLVCGFSFGLTAALMSYYVVDGVDYIALMRAEIAARQQAADEEERASAMATIFSTASAVAQSQLAASGGCVGPNTMAGAIAGFAGNGSGTVHLSSDGGGNGCNVASQSGDDSGADQIPVSIPRDSLPPTDAESSFTKSGSHGGPSNRPDASSQQDPLTNPDAVSLQTQDEVECLVLGYTTNATGEIRSILLAAAPDRRLLRFVGKVPVDQIVPEVRAEMLARFSDIPASKPMVRCPYGGRWIQPELFCLVNFDGWTFDNRLSNVEVTRLMNTQPN